MLNNDGFLLNYLQSSMMKTAEFQRTHGKNETNNEEKETMDDGRHPSLRLYNNLCAVAIGCNSRS